MARPPKGKALTLRPIRLDDDVWAECQRLGKEHGTINEGLRTALIVLGDVVTPVHPIKVAVFDGVTGKLVSKLFKGPLLKPKDKQK